jgi:multiple sugar transport system substrate-binding protein
MWVRGVNEGLNRNLADAFNATHEAQIEVVPVPDSEMVTKLGAAVLAGDVPDLLGSDVVQMPNLTSSNVYLDITDRVAGLPFRDQLSQAYLDVSTRDGRVYATPHAVDASTLFWNKELFRQAGLDPEKPPTNWAEIEEYSKKITALGNDTYGFYVPGNCSGCLAYDGLPLIWATGGDVFKENGTQASFDDPAVRDLLAFYRSMWDQGQMPPGAKTDNGANWLSVFAEGKIGMIGLGAFAIQPLKADHPDLDFGVALLPGKDGSTSSFAGGDVIGIPVGTKNVEGAWEFIAWELSEPAQIDVLAKNNQPTSRIDLKDNEYTAAEPRIGVEVEALAIAQTPYSVKYLQVINDANSPWLNLIAKAVFGGADIDAAIAEAQAQASAILSGS